MKKYDIIAFDLDGTLTDPKEGLTRGFEYALRKMGVEYGSREQLSRFIGPPLLSEFMKVYSMSEDDASETVRLFREYFSVYGWWDNRLYDGVPEMLESLKNLGYKIVLATSKPEIFAKKIVALFGIDKYFDFVGGASLDLSRAEKSQVLSYALSSVGMTDPKRAILVGDRIYDAEGAKICAIDSLGVLYGHGSEEEIRNAGFTYIAQGVSDIVDIIKKTADVKSFLIILFIYGFSDNQSFQCFEIKRKQWIKI